MKKILFVLFVFLSVACNDDEEALNIAYCTDGNPEIEPNTLWLEEVIKEINESSIAEYFYILQVSYNSETFFVVQNCCPFCGTVPLIYNCFGTQLAFDSELYKEVLEQDGGEIVARGEGFSCTI